MREKERERERERERKGQTDRQTNRETDGEMEMGGGAEGVGRGVLGGCGLSKGRTVIKN